MRWTLGVMWPSIGDDMGHHWWRETLQLGGWCHGGNVRCEGGWSVMVGAWVLSLILQSSIFSMIGTLHFNMVLEMLQTECWAPLVTRIGTFCLDEDKTKSTQTCVILVNWDAKLNHGIRQWEKVPKQFIDKRYHLLSNNYRKLTQHSQYTNSTPLTRTHQTGHIHLFKARLNCHRTQWGCDSTALESCCLNSQDIYPYAFTWDTWKPSQTSQWQWING